MTTAAFEPNKKQCDKCYGQKTCRKCKGIDYEKCSCYKGQCSKCEGSGKRIKTVNKD